MKVTQTLQPQAKEFTNCQTTKRDHHKAKTGMTALAMMIDSPGTLIPVHVEAVVTPEHKATDVQPMAKNATTATK